MGIILVFICRCSRIYSCDAFVSDYTTTLFHVCVTTYLPLHTTIHSLDFTQNGVRGCYDLFEGVICLSRWCISCVYCGTEIRYLYGVYWPRLVWFKSLLALTIYFRSLLASPFLIYIGSLLAPLKVYIWSDPLLFYSWYPSRFYSVGNLSNTNIILLNSDYQLDTLRYHGSDWFCLKV